MPYPIHYEFEYGKGALCIRHPLESILSVLHMRGSRTHNKSLAGDVHLENPELWNRFVTYQLGCWISFHDYWLNKAKSDKIPLFLFRYEDVKKDLSVVMKDLFRFVIGNQDLEGSYIFKKIDALKIQEAKQVYKPRTKARSTIEHFTEEQLAFVKDKAGHILDFFGYSFEEGKITTLPTENL